ncbi:MAG: lipopolysaccharide biosynthesis protein [Candidatus Omnitrophica bacterium]|nr:lipopolysaccharide biosynthesis protein [Candidatus Omnitrophota bacterium]
MTREAAILPDISHAPPPALVESWTGPAKESALSFRAFLRRSTALSAATILNALIQFPLGLLVAHVLGPEGLGVVGFVAVWQLYASMAKTGIYSAAQREATALLGQGKSREATALQHVGVTGEGIWVLLVAGVMVGAACLQSHPWLRHGLLIGAVGFIGSQAADFVTGLHFIRERFPVMAKTTVLSSLGSVIFVLSTIAWLKIYSPLLKTTVIALTTLLGFRLWAPTLALRWRWDPRECRRLLAVGLPLSLQTFLCWGFRSVDQAMAAVALPLTELGYFTFVKQCVSLGVLMVINLIIVIYPRLWAELERVANPQVLGPQIRRLLCWLLLVTCAMTSLSQAWCGALVHWLLPRYQPAIGLFELFAFLLAAGTLQNVPVYLLNSATLNRHRLVTAMWGSGFALHIGLTTWAIRAGWGLHGIVLCSVAAQTMFSVALLLLIHRYVVTGWRSGLSLYGWLGGLVLVTGGLFGVYHLGPFSYEGTSPVLTVFMGRTVLAVAVWGAMGWMVWRGGWSGVVPRLAAGRARR